MNIYIVSCPYENLSWQKMTAFVLSVIILVSLAWEMYLDLFLTRLLWCVVGQRDVITRALYVSRMSKLCRLVLLGTEISIVLLGVNCKHRILTSVDLLTRTQASHQVNLSWTPDLSIFNLWPMKDGADLLRVLVPLSLCEIRFILDVWLLCNVPSETQSHT